MWSLTLYASLISFERIFHHIILSFSHPHVILMKETQHIVQVTLFHTTKVHDDCDCQAPKFTSESTIALSQEQPKIPDLSWYFIVLFSVSIYCLFLS